VPQAFELVVLDKGGGRKSRRFASEDDLVRFLKSTRYTHAPISFTYRDGSPVPGKVMDRIHQRFFEER
jgi:hypothetical protein